MFVLFGGRQRPHPAPSARPTLEVLEGRAMPSGFSNGGQLGPFTLPPPDLSQPTIQRDAQELQAFASVNPGLVPLLRNGPQLIQTALDFVSVFAPGSLGQAEQLASDGLAILHQAGYI